MKSLLLPILTALLLISCDTDNDQKLKLDTVEKQIAFLEEINDRDQTARKNAQQIERQYGYDSDELRQANQKMSNADQENIKLIKAYLNQYGHPNLQEHGENATHAPWIVMHHSPHLSDRYDYFPYLYKNFISGDIDDGEYTFFLNRMYIMRYGERISWDRPFRVAEELDTLYSALELRPIIDSIDMQIIVP